MYEWKKHFSSQDFNTTHTGTSNVNHRITLQYPYLSVSCLTLKVWNKTLKNYSAVFFFSQAVPIFGLENLIYLYRTVRYQFLIIKSQLIDAGKSLIYHNSLMSTLTLMYGCAWTLISPNWQSH